MSNSDPVTIKDPQDKAQYQRNVLHFMDDERYKRLDEEGKREKLNLFFDKYTSPFLGEQGVKDTESYRDPFLNKYLQPKKKEEPTDLSISAKTSPFEGIQPEEKREIEELPEVSTETKSKEIEERKVEVEEFDKLEFEPLEVPGIYKAERSSIPRTTLDPTLLALRKDQVEKQEVDIKEARVEIDKSDNFKYIKEKPDVFLNNIEGESKKIGRELRKKGYSRSVSREVVNSIQQKANQDLLNSEKEKLFKYKSQEQVFNEAEELSKPYIDGWEEGTFINPQTGMRIKQPETDEDQDYLDYRNEAILNFSEIATTILEGEKGEGKLDIDKVKALHLDAYVKKNYWDRRAEEVGAQFREEEPTLGAVPRETLEFIRKKRSQANAEFEATSLMLHKNIGPKDIEKDAKFNWQIFGNAFAESLAGEVNMMDAKSIDREILTKINEVGSKEFKWTEEEEKQIEATLLENAAGLAGHLTPDLFMLIALGQGTRMLKAGTYIERLQKGYKILRNPVLKSSGKAWKIIVGADEAVPVGFNVLKTVKPTTWGKAQGLIYSSLIDEAVFTGVGGFQLGTMTGMNIAHGIRKVNYKGKWGKILGPFIDMVVKSGFGATAGMEAGAITGMAVKSLMDQDVEFRKAWDDQWGDMSEAGKRILAEFFVNTIVFGGMHLVTTGTAKKLNSPIGEEMKWYGSFSPKYRIKVLDAAREAEKLGYTQTAKQLYDWLDTSSSMLIGEEIRATRIEKAQEIIKKTPDSHLNKTIKSYEDLINILEQKKRTKKFDGKTEWIEEGEVKEFKLKDRYELNLALEEAYDKHGLYTAELAKRKTKGKEVQRIEMPEELMKEIEAEKKPEVKKEEYLEDTEYLSGRKQAGGKLLKAIDKTREKLSKGEEGEFEHPVRQWRDKIIKEEPKLTEDFKEVVTKEDLDRFEKAIKEDMAETEQKIKKLKKVEDVKEIVPEKKTKEDAINDLLKQREEEYEKVQKIEDLDERIKRATEVEAEYKEKITAQKAEGVYPGMDTTGPKIRSEAKAEIRKVKPEEKPKEEPPKITPEEVEVKVSKKVVEYPVEKIKVEPEKFQQRKEAYVEEHVQNIIDNWKDIDLDPVRLWKRPETDEVIVLAGHNRIEAARRMGLKTIESKFFEGTEAEAIEYARTSNVGKTLAETLTERASFYRNLRQKGTSKAEIKKQAVKNEGNNSERVIDYSHLNPDGRAIEILERFEKTGEGENTENIRNVAQFIGRARRTWPELTNAHETEMADFMLDATNYRNFGTMAKFQELIENARGMFFDPKEPLNLAKIRERSYEELDYENKLREYQNSLKAAKEDFNKKKEELDARYEKQQRLLKAGNKLPVGEIELTMEKRGEILKPLEAVIEKTQRELIAFKEEEGKYREAARQRIGLWDQPMVIKELEGKYEKAVTKGGVFGISIDDNVIINLWKKYLTSKGFMPKEAFDRYLKTKGKIHKELNKAHFLYRDLYRALKKHYGVTMLLSPKVSQEELIKINDILSRLGTENRGEALKELPEFLQEPIIAMRDHVDYLSREMIKSGLIEGDLELKINENLGYYLTRTYKAHSDPSWVWEKIPIEIKNNAINFVKKEFPKLSDMEVEGKLRELLYDKDGPFAMIKRGQLGEKDLGILKRRKDVPLEIRDFLGEYKDPMYNYSTSISKMANLIENHKFLEDIKEMGMDKWLFKKPTGEFHTPITDLGDYRMYPLSWAYEIKDVETGETRTVRKSYYTTKEIADVFDGFLKSDPIHPLLRVYMKYLNVPTKYGKTILSPVTHARNYFANYMFHVANGRVLWGKDFIGSHGTLLKQLSNRPNKEFRDYYGRLVELNVIGESTRAGEVHDIIKDATKYMEEFDKFGDDFYKKVTRKTLRVLEKMYQMEDDVHKIIAFENEKSRYEKVFKKEYPNATDDFIKIKAEGRAAEITRNTMPTYSMVPKLIKEIRRIPLVGTFVSFPAEVIRTTGNIIDISFKEMKNPDTRAIGIQRLAGLTTAMLITGAMSTLSRALLGIGRDEEDDLRRFIASWSKNSDLLVLKDKGSGVYTYIDIGFSDPYNYLKKPVTALIKGDSDFNEKAWESLTELVKPFLGEELLASRLMDIQRNTQKETGAPVYNTEAPLGDQLLQKWEFLWQGVQPGAIYTGKRIAKSFQKEVSEHGKGYSPKNEIMNLFLGLRSSDIDINRAYGFKIYRGGPRLYEALSIYRKSLYDEKMSEKEREKEFKKSSDAAERIVKELNNDYQAAIRLGVSADELDKKIDRLRVGNYPASKSVKEMIKTGKFIGIDEETGNFKKIKKEKKYR